MAETSPALTPLHWGPAALGQAANAKPIDFVCTGRREWERLQRGAASQYCLSLGTTHSVVPAVLCTPLPLHPPPTPASLFQP